MELNHPSGGLLRPAGFEDRVGIRLAKRECVALKRSKTVGGLLGPSRVRIPPAPRPRRGLHVGPFAPVQGSFMPTATCRHLHGASFAGDSHNRAPIARAGCLRVVAGLSRLSCTFACRRSSGSSSELSAAQCEVFRRARRSPCAELKPPVSSPLPFAFAMRAQRARCRQVDLDALLLDRRKLLLVVAAANRVVEVVG
jgi:hypothetical protein